MRPLSIAVVGLAYSSSWGNGHATTYRSLVRGLHRLGHAVTFLERDVPWYRDHRDLPDPSECRLVLYETAADLDGPLRGVLAAADAVVVGSYVPDGAEAIDRVLGAATGPVLFYDIDTPVTLAALARGEETFLARRQIPAFDAYLSFTGGPTLARLETEFGARRAEPLYCSAEDTVYRPLGESAVWDLGYLGTYSPDRQPTLERLQLEPARRLPERRFVVAGPQYPATIDWPANVTRIEHLGPAEHAAFYNRQRWTLNVTRADMIAAGWSPSVRLFEAAACGTPIVSDAWEGLTDLFPDGEAIVVARTADDVVALLTADDERRRRRIAEAARARVLAGHTGTARAAELAALLAGLADDRPTVRRVAV